MPELAVADSISPDLDSKMDAVFGGSANDALPEEIPQLDAKSSGDPTPEDTPQVDEQAAEGTDPAPQPAVAKDPEVVDVPEGDADDDIDLDQLAASGGKSVKLDLPRFRQIYQNHKMAKEISQFAPSLDVAKNHYERANDLRHMWADFTSNSPEGATGFLEYWKSQAPEAFPTMVTRALEMAPPEIQEQVSSAAIQSAIDAAYGHAAETGDPLDLYRAQGLEFGIHGKYRTKEQLAAAPKPDPVDVRLKEIETREAAWKSQQAKQANDKWQSYQTDVVNKAYTELGTAIDSVLKPVTDSYKDNPQLLADLKNGIRNDVVNRVAQDAEWVRQFNLDMRAARATQDDVTAKALVDMYMAKVQGLVRAAAKPRMSQAATTVKAQSDAKHDALARSQNKREVVSGGKAAPVAVPRAPGGASLDDKINNFWSQQDLQQPRR